MQEYFVANMRQVRYGLLLVLITLLYGFGLGGVFGLFEDDIKGHLKTKAGQVLSTTYNGDASQLKKVTDKSWTYFKRAHVHAIGLGTASLGLIFFVLFLGIDRRLKSITALCLGLGSLGYSFFWMLAGLVAPGMGSTGLAKESLKWLAVPSTGLCIIALVMVVGSVIMSLFIQGKDQSNQ
ncbi:MAG: hypothetical protein QGH40_09040 [bacterium]|jgi:hypothetical protein|nr:hypothetical protein [bacterium]